MPSPYSGCYTLTSPRDKQRLYEIIERCGSMGLGYPMWFEDQYNGIIESMPPNVFMLFLDALVLEGELFIEHSRSTTTQEIRTTGEAISDMNLQPDSEMYKWWVSERDEISEDFVTASRCYQDAARIRKNVIRRYKRWYAKDYGPYRPLESLNDPRYDPRARLL